MVKTTVYLDDEIVASLKGLSKRSGKPQAELIRDALHAFTGAANISELKAAADRLAKALADIDEEKPAWDFDRLRRRGKTKTRKT